MVAKFEGGREIRWEVEWDGWQSRPAEPYEKPLLRRSKVGVDKTPGCLVLRPYSLAPLPYTLYAIPYLQP
jgi:hypothetical protein